MNQEHVTYAIAVLTFATVANASILVAVYRNLKKEENRAADAFEKPFERKKKPRPVTLFKASTGFGNHLLDHSDE